MAWPRKSQHTKPAAAPVAVHACTQTQTQQWMPRPRSRAALPLCTSTSTCAGAGGQPNYSSPRQSPVAPVFFFPPTLQRLHLRQPGRQDGRRPRPPWPALAACRSIERALTDAAGRVIFDVAIGGPRPAFCSGRSSLAARAVDLCLVRSCRLAHTTLARRRVQEKTCVRVRATTPTYIRTGSGYRKCTVQ